MLSNWDCIEESYDLLRYVGVKAPGNHWRGGRNIFEACCIAARTCEDLEFAEPGLCHFLYASNGEPGATFDFFVDSHITPLVPTTSGGDLCDGINSTRACGPST